MINTYKIRKVAGLTLSPLIVVITFYLGLIMYGFVISLLFMGVAILITYFISALFIKNPFSDMIEGKGILCLNMDSTGILTPFIVAVDSPYIFGKRRGQRIKDVFDREAVFNLATPKKIVKNAVIDDNKNALTIELNEQEYNKGRFSLLHYPCLIWNDQIKSILTKDFFSQSEKTAFADHQILYLNRNVQELSGHLLHFSRYVVEQTKPTSEWYKSKWVWIIIVACIIILLVMFAPSIYRAVMQTVGTGSGALTGVITPVG